MAIDFTIDDLHGALQSRLNAMRGVQAPQTLGNDPLAGIRLSIKARQGLTPQVIPPTMPTQPPKVR